MLTTSFIVVRQRGHSRALPPRLLLATSDTLHALCVRADRSWLFPTECWLSALVAARFAFKARPTVENDREIKNLRGKRNPRSGPRALTQCGPRKHAVDVLLPTCRAQNTLGAALRIGSRCHSSSAQASHDLACAFSAGFWRSRRGSVATSAAVCEQRRWLRRATSDWCSSPAAQASFAVPGRESLCAGLR
jgi:hypothetical protein